MKSESSQSVSMCIRYFVYILWSTEEILQLVLIVLLMSGHSLDRSQAARWWKQQASAGGQLCVQGSSLWR